MQPVNLTPGKHCSQQGLVEVKDTVNDCSNIASSRQSSSQAVPETKNNTKCEHNKATEDTVDST